MERTVRKLAATLAAVLVVSLSACGAPGDQGPAISSADPDPVTSGDGTGKERDPAGEKHSSKSPMKPPVRANPGDPKGGLVARPPALPQAGADPYRFEPDGMYETSSTVLESRDHGPELCVGGIATSLPPQCGGVPIPNWDWDAVEGEESRSGTTWGTFYVRGHYDGETFTVEGAGKYRTLRPTPRERRRDSDFGPACPRPPGGWRAEDDSKWSHEDVERVSRWSYRHGDASALWLSYIRDPNGDEREAYDRNIILNLGFAHDPETHRARIRQMWGGPLCLVEHERTRRELSGIQNDLHERAERQFGLMVVGSGTDEVRNRLQLDVIASNKRVEHSVDAYYGKGVVIVYPQLRPVR